MPPKRDKRKAGGNGGGGGGGTTATGRRLTRGHNASAAAASGGGNGGATGHSKRVTTPKPEGGGSGRNTNNSRGKRRPATSRAQATPTAKRAAGKRRGKKEKELTSFKDESGDVYKIGDFAYVDSQQPDLPHHICVIRDFKLDRKDSVIAEVKWFYRVSELPESVYDLLMQDRRKGKDAEMYQHSQMKERELFTAFNIDTHSASLFRGKCKVKLLSDISSIDTYMTDENSFFYVFGYKPESRRLTLTDEDIYIPQSQQAELPECQLAPPSSPSSSSGSPRPLPVSERYSRPEPRIENLEELVWKPHQLADEQLLMYLRAARSIALHAGVCMKGLITDGYLAASADETTQHAFNTLHRNGHSTEKALQELVKRPTVGQLVAKRNWNKESTVLFAKGMRQFGKNFFKIQKELLPKKQIKELCEYYYYWKKTNPGLSSRNTRRQRKQTHIRLSRMLMKPREVTPEREYMDWSSCDEDETADEEGEKAQNVYICRQCYSTDSPNWHHAGQQKAILCETCRLYYKKYGLMKPVEVSGKPPDVLYKSYYESPSNDDTGMASGSRRKTRNSNGSRGVASRPGLRSQKIVNKNDSEEEEEVTDSSSEGSVEEDNVRSLPQPKQKALQTRRSILDQLDDSAKATPTNATDSSEQTPPAKRIKTEEGNESDEEGSTGSTNGEGDRESSASAQKSPSSGPSMTQTTLAPDKIKASTSLMAMVQEPLPGPDPTSVNIPQNFTRLSSDPETCARTDLVYVHPPPEEKPPSIPKLHPQVVQRLTGPLPPPSHPPLSSQTNPKIPIITNYAPQLPMGPGPILPFPFPYPQIGTVTPMVASTTSAGSVPPAVTSHGNTSFQRRPESVEASAAAVREAKRAASREEEFVFHMRQQQLLQATAAAQQQQQQQQAVAHVHSHPQLLTPHLVQGAVTQAPPISHAHQASHPADHHAQSGQPQPQQAFTFPTPEEMALHQQRLMALVQSGAIQVSSEPFPGAAAMFQPGLYPAHLHPVGHSGLTIEAISHLRPEEQAAAAAMLAAQHQAAQVQAAAAAHAQGQFIPGMVSPAIMEQLIAAQQQQQQQQQAALVVAAATGGLTENILEIQRQYEALALSVQKNPLLLAQNPQYHVVIERYQRILQEHHIQQQQQQQRMHEAMIQSSQQHELHKQLLLARVPGGAVAAAGEENSASRGIRTGVIVHPN